MNVEVNKFCFKEYYQTGKMRCPPSVSASELREACDYLLIPFNAQTVHCQNLRSFLHELSNEGARQQFTEFLEDIILPQMVASTEVIFISYFFVIQIYFHSRSPAFSRINNCLLARFVNLWNITLLVLTVYVVSVMQAVEGSIVQMVKTGCACTGSHYRKRRDENGSGGRCVQK